MENLRDIYPLPEKVSTRATTSLGEVRQPRFPSVLLELPLKYMHTSVETFDMHALTECARLLTAYCAAIDDSWRDELWN